MWPMCVVGLTAITVATGRKRLRSALRDRREVPRTTFPGRARSVPRLAFGPYAKNASQILAAAPATTQ